MSTQRDHAVAVHQQETAFQRRDEAGSGCPGENQETARGGPLNFACGQIELLLADFMNATEALLRILQGVVSRLEPTVREDPRDRESRRELR